jgi:tetratricopeptide (TPR) repeat protein
VVEFFEENRKFVQWGITGAIVLVLGVVIYARNASSNEAAAAAELGKIFPYVDREEYEIALNGIPERNVAGLLSIIDNYGGTDSGDLARFYAATSLYRLERYNEALDSFEHFGPSHDFLKVSRLSGIGACYEALHEYESAAEYFEQAAGLVPTNASVPENLHHAARNYGLAGQKEKAVDLLRKLKKNHPNTTFGREADRFISQVAV